jgi:hypothetical protein
MKLANADGWSVTTAVYAMAATGEGHNAPALNGPCFVVKRHGFHVKTVRTVEEVASFVPLHTLQETS